MQRDKPVSGRSIRAAAIVLTVLVSGNSRAIAQEFVRATPSKVSVVDCPNCNQTSRHVSGQWCKHLLSHWPFHGKPSTTDHVEIPCTNSREVGPDGFRYSAYCGRLAPQRVVIVTCANRLDRLKEQDLFAESLANSLVGHVDVILSHRYACDRTNPLRSGRYDERELLELSEEFNADAVLYCDVEKLHSYTPMKMQVSLVLVHVGEAVALVAGTESIDLTRANAQAEYQAFSTPASKNTVLDVRQHSPREFIRYCSNVISEKLQKGISR